LNSVCHVAPVVGFLAVALNELPTFPVFPVDEALSVFRVRDAHFLAVPLNLFAGAISDVAEVVGFGEQAGVFEIGAARLAVFGALDPFDVMAG
jgi:hypothetical protein